MLKRCSGHETLELNLDFPKSHEKIRRFIFNLTEFVNNEGVEIDFAEDRYVLAKDRVRDEDDVGFEARFVGIEELVFLNDATGDAGAAIEKDVEGWSPFGKVLEPAFGGAGRHEDYVWSCVVEVVYTVEKGDNLHGFAQALAPRVSFCSFWKRLFTLKWGKYCNDRIEGIAHTDSSANMTLRFLDQFEQSQLTPSSWYGFRVPSATKGG